MYYLKHNLVVVLVLLGIVIVVHDNMVEARAYPRHGVVAFRPFGDKDCRQHAYYRQQRYLMLAPKRDTCYKCVGKAYKYPYMDPKHGQIRQCVNLNNQCNDGSWSCTDIHPGTCVPHPCVQGDALFGTWTHVHVRGVRVQPHETIDCDADASLDMPVFYVDTEGRCTILQSHSIDTPFGPVLTWWNMTITDHWTARDVTVCRLVDSGEPAAYEDTSTNATCPVTRFHTQATCDAYVARSHRPPCGDGKGWPLLNAPKATVQYIHGPSVFASLASVVFPRAVLSVGALMTVLWWSLLS